MFTQVKARNLVRLGVNVTVIHPTKFWKPDAGLSVEQASTAGRVEPSVRHPAYMSFSSKRIPVLGSTFPWTMIAFERAVRRALQDLEIHPTHLYGQFLFPAGYVAARLSAEFGAKSTVDIGESNLKWYESHLGIKKIRLTLRKLDSAFVVADHLRRLCIDRYHIPKDRIATFRNGADVGFRSVDRKQARSQLALPQDRPIVGFIGTFNSSKRPVYVLDAIRNRPDIAAFFLGHSVSETSEIPVGDQVLFAGAVPHQRVPIWLSAADVYVHASLREGSPNAIAEAKACGLPIVATNIPGNRELLKPEFSILVDPLDQAAMSEAIFKIVDHPELRNQMSEAALKSAQEYTSLDRVRDILSWLRSKP